MFKKIKNKKLSDDVVDQICDIICEGKIQKGEFLPSEYKLCQQLGVSRTTMREALSILNQRGMIETIRGKGSEVIGCDTNGSYSALLQEIERDNNKYEYAHQIRLLLEPQVTAAVAEMADVEDVTALEEMLVTYEKKAKVGELTVEHLKSFHLYIAGILKNPLLNLILELSIDMNNTSQKTEPDNAGLNVQFQKDVLMCYNEILNSIKAVDIERCGILMKKTLVTIGEKRDY